MAEWLRRGLQILAPRFDSGRGLHFLPSRAAAGGVSGDHRRGEADGFDGFGPGRRGAARCMVNSQLRCLDVNDLEVLAAFLATPREPFVAPAKARFAYLDGELPSPGSPARKLLAAGGAGAPDPGGGSQSRRARARRRRRRGLRSGDSRPPRRRGDGARERAGRGRRGAQAAGRSAGDRSRRRRSRRRGQEPRTVRRDRRSRARSKSSPRRCSPNSAKTGRLVGIDARAGAAEAALIERTRQRRRASRVVRGHCAPPWSPSAASPVSRSDRSFVIRPGGGSSCNRPRRTRVSQECDARLNFGVIWRRNGGPGVAGRLAFPVHWRLGVCRICASCRRLRTRPPSRRTQSGVVRIEAGNAP